MSCTYAIIHKCQLSRILHRVVPRALSSRMVEPANYGAVDMYAATDTTVTSPVVRLSFTISPIEQKTPKSDIELNG
jgi:hypothetical protein